MLYSQARREGSSGGMLSRGPVSWHGPVGDQFSESFEVFRDLTRKMCKLIDFGVNDYKKSRQNF